jgi:hypothetical protein
MPRTRRSWLIVAVTAVLLILAGGALFLRMSGTPPAELVELLAENGEKILREPMRPVRGTSRVLVFALDGVGADELGDAIAGGAAPNIASLLGSPSSESGLYEHAYAVPGVLSVLPSTTLAAWSSLFTGQPPAYTGIPGNEWFAREEMRFYAPAPVSVTENGDALRVYTDDLIGEALRVPTLYERVPVRSFVSLSQVYRGADLLTLPDLGALGDLVEAVARGVTEEEGVGQEAFVELDRIAVEDLLGSLREHGIPDLQIVYLPGIDLFTHVSEQPIAEQHQYLREVIDVSIGELLSFYREGGVLQDTYVLFVADHGHTPVLPDERHALGIAEGDPPALLEQVGFRLRPFVVEPDEEEQDYQATVAYQGAFAYVYLADRSTCPNPGTRCDWNRPPRMEEDVLAVVRAFDRANDTGEHAPKLQGALDLVFARQPVPVGQDALPFEVWDGARLVPIASYLAANPRPELVDLEARLKGLAAGPYGHRAGDVLLLARSGVHLPIEERFYFSGLYRSWHGSPTDQDSRIPLVVARAGASGEALRGLITETVGDNPSQLDITPLIEALLQTTPR